MVGVEFNRATIGRTVYGFTGPKEQRIGGSVDVSYRFWDRYSLVGQYGLMHTANRDFRPGDDGLDHLLLVQFTRSFR
jgi:hypothetical protein